MTKHLYPCLYMNKPAYVLIGWDSTRKGYYLIIDYQSGQDETPIFSNLFSAKKYPKTLDQYLQHLVDVGIKLPQEMIDDVLRDGFRNAEDKEATHEIISGQYIYTPAIDYAIL